MVKLNSRIIATILLVVWSSTICAGNWSSQRRSVVVNPSDPGEIVFFILYVVVAEFGKKLDKSYVCPVYCDVDHKHIYEAKESNIQTVNRISRPATSEDREQSEVVLRTCPDVHRLCGDDRQIGETE